MHLRLVRFPVDQGMQDCFVCPLCERMNNMPMDYTDFFDAGQFTEVRLLCHPSNLLVEYIPENFEHAKKPEETEVVVRHRTLRGEEGTEGEEDDDEHSLAGIAVRYLPEDPKQNFYFRCDFWNFSEAKFWSTGDVRQHGLSVKSIEHPKPCQFQVQVSKIRMKDYKKTPYDQVRPFSESLQHRIDAYYTDRRTMAADTDKHLAIAVYEFVVDEYNL